jgi:SAM-dependent methyltransferase
MATLTTWSEGYVTDALYTDNTYREQSPSWINHVAVLNGSVPRPLDRPFAYLELGCGLGHSITIFAACFPEGRFVGVDFNPAHIDHAQRRAAELGLGNLTFVEASFQDLAADPSGTGIAAALGQFDFVALHGIYSWITPEARNAAQRLIFDRLKSGGLVYNSYNCMPGWAAEAPIQRLLAEFSPTEAGSSSDRARGALARINEVAALKVGYFQVVPQTAAHLAQLGSKKPNYLAHEYLNGMWTTFYSDDVATEMTAAKLDFLGSATLIENMTDLLFRDDVRAYLTRHQDPRRRQLLQDFLNNQKFRRDVFVRGHARLEKRERQAWLNRQCVVALTPIQKLSATVRVPSGMLNFDKDAHEILKGLLAGGAMSRGDLMANFTKSGGKAKDLGQIITAMTVSGQLAPAARASQVRTTRATGDKLPPQRLTVKVNARILASSLERRSGATLASPVAGFATGLNITEVMLLDIALSGGTIATMADRLGVMMKERGIRPAKDGKAIEGEDATRAHFHDLATAFVEETVPSLQRLGVLAS